MSEAIIRLVRNGHNLGEALSFTPRQIVAILKEHERIKKTEMADALSINTLAARGEAKDIQKQHKALIDEF